MSTALIFNGNCFTELTNEEMMLVDGGILDKLMSWEDAKFWKVEEKWINW